MIDAVRKARFVLRADLHLAAPQEWIAAAYQLAFQSSVAEQLTVENALCQVVVDVGIFGMGFELFLEIRNGFVEFVVVEMNEARVCKRVL